MNEHRRKSFQQKWNETIFNEWEENEEIEEWEEMGVRAEELDKCSGSDSTSKG